MLKLKKKNKIINYMLQPMPKKHSNFLLVSSNFFIGGILPYFVGCLGWIVILDLTTIDLINFIWFTIFVISILAGELRICIFYEKYFIDKNFEPVKKDLFEETPNTLIYHKNIL